MKSSDSINEENNDMQVLLEKQDSQFRALTEALKYSLKNLGSTLDNSLSKLSKSFDEKIEKLSSAHNNGQPEYINRERQETGTPSSNPNGKKGVGPAKLPGNPNKNRIISQDNDSLSLLHLQIWEMINNRKRTTLLERLCLWPMIHSH